MTTIPNLNPIPAVTGDDYLITHDIATNRSGRVSAASLKSYTNSGIDAGDITYSFTNVENQLDKSTRIIPNFAALSSTGGFIGDKVYLLGHTVAGIGGGYFIAQSSTGLTANTGTVSVFGALAWVRQFDAEIDIEYFGAYQDNQDITFILNAADNFCAGKYPFIFKTKRTYLISGELNISCKMDLGECTLKQAAGSNVANLVFINSPGAEIHNGEIDINVSQQSYSAPKTDVGRAIFAYNTNNVKVFGTKFKNPYGSMILAAACTKVSIFGCDINDAAGTGTNAIVFNTCSDSYANGCTGLGKVGATGYGIHAFGDCENLRAEGNNLKYWQITFIGEDYITAGTYSKMRYCRIDGNTLNEPSADTSIHFGFFGSVSNNIILNSHDVGISIDYSRFLAINGNTILESNASGIGMPGCICCSVTGNVLMNPGSQWFTPVDLGQRSGIWCPRSFSENPPYIYPYGNSFSGNTIIDNKGTHTMYAGISIANDSGANINAIGKNYVSGYLTVEYDVPVQTNIQGTLVISRPTLSNSWVNVGSGYEDVGYYKTTDGECYIVGLMSSGTVGAPAFILPQGFRPKARMVFTCINDTGVSRVDIYANGEVVVSSGTTVFVSLSGIKFPVR
jgi:carbonic anhydrase/acetyltransferase-like protein (isoleucine patch superfamily)